jgi:hypothetical protein
MPENGLGEDVQDPFIWLYNQNIVCTPSIAGVSSCHSANEYDSAWRDVSPSYSATGVREFRQWLPASGYDRRRCSTDDYRSLLRHDPTTFRSEAKAIFRHVLNQLAPNDADVV